MCSEIRERCTQFCLREAYERMESGLYFYGHFVSGSVMYLETHAHLVAAGDLVGQLQDNVLEPGEVWHRAKMLDGEWENLAGCIFGLSHDC